MDGLLVVLVEYSLSQLSMGDFNAVEFIDSRDGEIGDREVSVPRLRNVETRWPRLKLCMGRGNKSEDRTEVLLDSFDNSSLQLITSGFRTRLL